MKNIFPYRLQVPPLISQLLFLLLLAGINTSAQQPKKKLPNIIYIYADDLGYGELGAYGQEKIKTPHLDQMAQEGMRFTQHYSGAPVCAPSRAMLMTGKHAGHAYIRGNYELGGFGDDEEGGQMPLPAGTFTLPALLKKAGYKTALVGKWGLGMAGTTGSPLQQGFDYYYSILDQKQAHNYYPTHVWKNDRPDPLNNPYIYVHKPMDTASGEKGFAYYKGKDYVIDRMTAKAGAFIDSNQKQPFFLYLSYTLPHISLQAPDDFVNAYRGQFAEQPYYGQHGYAATPYPYSTYAAMITCLDAQVGFILEKIKQAGLDSNTIIMFSSDNGPTFHRSVDTKFFASTGGLRGLKMDVYEGGIRVPFIVRWPGVVKAGTTSPHISTQYDLMATLAELTGQAIAGTTDGISFLPELKGKHAIQKQHPYLYFEYPENGGQVAIRSGDWKAVRINIRKDQNAAWQLFDLKKDPGETKDIASKHPVIIERMIKIQAEAHQHPHIREWEFIDPKFASTQ
jgi:arylsulfatase A